MSTRSNIAIHNENGTIDVIYCHSDGYPSWNGRILLEHYTDPEKIRKLIALGDLSTLGENIGKKCNFNAPPKGQCLAYGRDRGEHNTQAKNYRLGEFFPDKMEEYFYYYTEGKWFFSDHGKTLQELTKEICEK